MLEYNTERHNLCVENINDMNVSHKVLAIHDDALEVFISQKFDVIFIDAAKAKNIKFFEKYKVNLADNGSIITDNLSFHGLVEDESLAITKNQKGLVKRIKNFIEFLDNNKEFKTTYIAIGDKISISKKIKE